MDYAHEKVSNYFLGTKFEIFNRKKKETNNRQTDKMSFSDSNYILSNDQEEDFVCAHYGI